ncbi:hypothetical protein CARUB_v10027746mg [Capsella rubella]|uniref:FBD domain-containing protein n=1 Tax=Capsella rubella TaxID=81985 RepID=R0G7D4_9BRAS|nr:putative F-box/FBD/LRR-repeat protein At5g62970 [Capsella rubella]EOA12414.1 hypothetical protein CARUB_v10027746mg [Capsella rubella]
MDKITGFSDDELLVKILSFLPTKFAITTSVLSKQWKFLWLRVPKLVFNERSMYSSDFFDRYFLLRDTKTYSKASERCQRMRCFIDKNLPLHSSPVMESLRLRFYNALFEPEAIKLWVEIAISRCVKELSVTFIRYKGIGNVLLPSSLYTCKSLVTLELKYDILVDVPHAFGLPSLKTLHLRRVIYADEESFQRLISNSSVLEDLVLELHPGGNVRKLAVIIPSLLSLSLMMPDQCSEEYRIDTPSLKYLKVRDYCKSSSSLIENMPKLEEAEITAGYNIRRLLELVTSVKRLSIAISLDEFAEAAEYNDEHGIVFNELQHLKFHINHAYCSKVLYWLLIASPKLRNLELREPISRDHMGTLVCWKHFSVPQCLLSSLQTFKWRGRVDGKDLVKYILKNSCQLKTATIMFGPELDPQEKLEIETEVKFCFRGSSTCNLKVLHL